MILLGALLIFGAIVLLVLGLSWQKPHPMNARIATLRGERFEMDHGSKVEPVGSRVLAPLANSLGEGLKHMLPGRLVASVDKKLIQAGQPTTTSGFVAGSVVTEAVMIVFGLLVFSAGSGIMSVLILGTCAVFGLIMPKVWLDNRVRYRQKEILKSLPDAFDLITVCVEAGLGLEAALARVAEKVEGPFGEELNIMLREVALGKLRREAMRELSDRTGVPDLTSFINAVVQAETMGTSIAAVLRVQAEQMRTKRRQRAEQQAQAAPIKMMFPLVLCIFPTLFIVILGPAGISIYEQLVAKE